MFRTNTAIAYCLSIVLVQFTFISCGGGGGGDGGPAGRTTGPGVRFIHAGVDLAPLNVVVDEQVIQSARFADKVEFVSVSQGPVQVNLSRLDDPGANFRSLSVNVEDRTEYTVFLSGSRSNGTVQTQVLEEPVEQPESERARVQLLNGLDGSRTLTLQGSGITPVAAVLGGSTGFVDVASGPQQFIAIAANGEQVAQFNVELADRGELTLLVAGSQDFGFRFQRTYDDLD